MYAVWANAYRKLVATSRLGNRYIHAMRVERVCDLLSTAVYPHR
jgi:hypothetical protein